MKQTACELCKEFIERDRKTILAESESILNEITTIKQKYDKALKYLCDNVDCPIDIIKDDSYCSDNCGWKPDHSACWDLYFSTLDKER